MRAGVVDAFAKARIGGMMTLKSVRLPPQPCFHNYLPENCPYDVCEFRDLKRQLAEARRKAFEEAAEIANLMADKYDKSRVNVSQRAIAAREVAEALREAGKGLEG